MIAQRRNVPRGLSLLVALSMVFFAVTASAQNAAQFIKVGNNAYNSGKYAEAVAAYISAIQTEPLTATKAYLNVARAYNQLGQYAESAQYYAWFGELSPDSSDLQKANAELKRVKKKIKAGDPTNILTPTQESAIKSLEAAMKSGPFLDSHGGGAYGAYDIILKTGYATPKLAAMKVALAAGLQKEALALVKPELGQPTASLDTDGWALIRERMAKVKELDPAGVDANATEGVEALAEGWTEYAKGNYADAKKLFEHAISLKPQLLAAQWGRALTMIYDFNVELDEMLAFIDEVEALYKADGSLIETHFVVLRAIALQNAGKKREAAKLLNALSSAP
ncbi:MAG: hypothetical protein AUK47_19785 [Deltaproteobacteria bacterium CG2_30_63_29]|nr:MAG: hypothetical protein AUK47_19785 [Deltaproteobacteria bacterium CG2_30_63_29]PIV98577.1 MAG: hypothetical protein COW42_13855 [Deltaproteobacteria bacterium CG17_big_fil_post_rev_8_21_14_2_50_63_7]